MLRTILITFITLYTIVILGFFVYFLPEPSIICCPLEAYFWGLLGVAILFVVTRWLLISLYPDRDLILVSLNIAVNLFLNILYLKSGRGLEKLSYAERHFFQGYIRFAPFIYAGFIDFITNVFMWLALVVFVFVMIRRHRSFIIPGKILLDKSTKPYFFVFTVLFIFVSSATILSVLPSPEFRYVLLAQWGGKKLLQTVISIFYTAVFIYTQVKLFLTFATTPEPE